MYVTLRVPSQFSHKGVKGHELTCRIRSSNQNTSKLHHKKFIIQNYIIYCKEPTINKLKNINKKKLVI